MEGWKEEEALALCLETTALLALRSVAAAGGEAHIYRHVHPEGGGRGTKSAACLATVASRKMSVTYIACMHAYWQILGHDHTRALVLACRSLVDESEPVGEKNGA